VTIILRNIRAATFSVMQGDLLENTTMVWSVTTDRQLLWIKGRDAAIVEHIARCYFRQSPRTSTLNSGGIVWHGSPCHGPQTPLCANFYLCWTLFRWALGGYLFIVLY